MALNTMPQVVGALFRVSHCVRLSMFFRESSVVIVG
jgi:hypothetical protein